MADSRDVLEIIAGTPPGGGQDRAARALAEALGGDVEVVNVPGRGGGNGWDMLSERVGDPCVVAISSPTLITNRALGIATLDEHDVTPLAQLCMETLAFVVAEGGDIASAADLQERFGAGNLVSAIATERGNVNHIALGRVIRAAGGAPTQADVNVFDSARYAISDVVAGNAGLAVVSAASALPEISEGTVRVLAVSSAERMPPPFDTTPTWVELGVPCVIGTWRGVVGPPGLPPDAVDQWEHAIAAAAGSAVWQEALVRHLWVDTYLGHRGSMRFLEVERANLVGGLRDLGLVADVG